MAVWLDLRERVAAVNAREGVQLHAIYHERLPAWLASAEGVTVHQTDNTRFNLLTYFAVGRRHWPVSSPCELPKIENGLRVWTRGNSLNS